MTADEGLAAAERIDALDWVGRIAEGDCRAETEFVRHFQRGVRTLVRRRCRPGDPAVDDLTQNVLAKVLERLRAGAIRDAAALPAYIRATVAHATSAEYRKPGGADAIAHFEQPLPVPDPAEQVMATQFGDLLRSTLQALPVARDREVLTRFYLEEQDRDEICRSLDIDAGHFRRVMFRARERFRELLLAAGLDGR